MHRYDSIHQEDHRITAGNCLFQVRPPDEANYLPEEQARAFHHTMAQLLFLSCVRRDIQTTAAFLTTGVKCPDNDDWGKLKRVLKYLLSTRRLRLTLFAESLSNIARYFDTSHQLHDDCKGHMGSILTFGRGATTSSSTNRISLLKVHVKVKSLVCTTRSAMFY